MSLYFMGLFVTVIVRRVKDQEVIIKSGVACKVKDKPNSYY